MNAAQRKPLARRRCDALDWPQGIGPKLKQMLRRGVGVHHAGLLPKYRRGVEDLFEKKLLSVALCTETLAAGINLPARSVVLTSLVKGPFGKEKLIDPSSAHQIFGRAGRPQFDTEGHVYALPHEDDVRIAKWKEKYDQIPETSKDPVMLKKKKEMLKKKPPRNSQRKYWTSGDFEKLQGSAPARLYSKGPLPVAAAWRTCSRCRPEVDKIRTVIRKRLLDQPRIEAGLKQLNRMLTILHDRGFVQLQPAPPPPVDPAAPLVPLDPTVIVPPAPPYSPTLAVPTPEMAKLLVFRAVHPLYGAFLVDQLGTASREERIQAFESVLELPRPLLKFVRVPWELPAGPYATDKLDPELIARGLIQAPAPPAEGDEPADHGYVHWEDRPPVFADKLRLLFDATHPDVADVTTQAVWAAGEVLNFGGHFNNFIASKDLAKQEGLIFRHLLRMILLLEEFQQLTPAGCDPRDWQQQLGEIADTLTKTCKSVDPHSTEQTIKVAHAAADVVKGEEAAVTTADAVTAAEEEFGAGLLDD